MDDDKQSVNKNVPGAPELGSGVKPPSAPLVNEKQTGPIFRAEPRTPTEPAVPVDTAPDPFDDDEDDGPDAPPAVDEHQARIEYLQSLRQNSPKKKKRRFSRSFIVAGLILVIVGALGAAAYYFYSGSRPTKAKPVAATAQQAASNTEKRETTEQPSSAAATKEYTSAKFGLSLTYPEDWTPEELADKLAITSPVLTLTNGGGQATSGKIVFSVRPRQDKPAEFAAGNVVAVLASDKVNYTKPSAAQRATTYLSYLQFAATTVKGGLDGIYITGNYGYKYAQVVQLSEISKIDPLVNVTFIGCADTACASATQKPLTLSSTAWKSDTTNRPAVEAMLKSLVL